MAVDVVCGKDVSEAGVDGGVGHVPAGAPETNPAAGTKRFYDGKWYYFCSMACAERSWRPRRVVRLSVGAGR